MVQLPAKCVNPTCGYVDPSPGAVMLTGDISRKTFVDMIIHRGCKRCGSDMRVLDRTFSTRDDQLILDDGAEWTRRSLWEIRTTLEYPKDNLRARPVEARRRVEEISPSLAAVIWDRASGRNAMATTAYLSLVTGVFGLIITLRDSSETLPQIPSTVQNALVVQQREGTPLSEKEIEDIMR